MYKKILLLICFASACLSQASSRAQHDRLNTANEEDLAIMNDNTQSLDDRRAANLRYTLRNYDTIMARQGSDQINQNNSSSSSSTSVIAERPQYNGFSYIPGVDYSQQSKKEDLIHEITYLRTQSKTQKNTGTLYVSIACLSGLATAYLFTQPTKSPLFPYVPLVSSLYFIKKAQSSFDKAHTLSKELTTAEQQLATLQSASSRQ